MLGDYQNTDRQSRADLNAHVQCVENCHRLRVAAGLVQFLCIIARRVAVWEA